MAASQRIDQDYQVIVQVPVITWQLDHDTGTYTSFTLPSSTDGTSTGVVPFSRGYGLIMSANYLVVGDHDATPRVLQLWVRVTLAMLPPWDWVWTANDPCPGHYFGFSVAVDERLPLLPHSGIFGTVIAGDPAARATGRVYVYFTYSPAYWQVLNAGFGNETESWCFGESVSADSGWLAIGAPRLPYASQPAAGSVFVYQWDATLNRYVFFTQITPPVPSTNGGFGEAVSVWENFIMIGDNMRTVYLYVIIGLSAIPLPLEQPEGINLISQLGMFFFFLKPMLHHHCNTATSSRACSSS